MNIFEEVLLFTILILNNLIKCKLLLYSIHFIEKKFLAGFRFGLVGEIYLV